MADAGSDIDRAMRSELHAMGEALRADISGLTTQIATLTVTLQGSLELARNDRQHIRENQDRESERLKELEEAHRVHVERLHTMERSWMLDKGKVLGLLLGVSTVVSLAVTLVFGVLGVL